LGPFALTLLFGLAIEPGIYVWDGVRGPGALEKSGDLAAQAGFRGVRLLLSPASRRTYGLAGDRSGSLSALFASDPIQSVLQRKELRTVMFTAYDFASYPNSHFMDPKFLAANRQRVFDEYEQLTEEIMRRESGTGREFVIGHWEGDNQVYCGSSFKFLTQDAERARCLAQNPGERLEGLGAWLRIRQEAIAAGRQRAKQAGAKDVEVWHAVEFNSLFHFRGVPGAGMRAKDYHGVLDALVPVVKPDFCSYSAWESLLPDRLEKDLKVVAKACGPARVVIGELGYQPTEEHRDPTKDYLKAVAVLKKVQTPVAMVFFWEAFHQGFGLFGADGIAAWPKVVEAMRGLE
jgi:hypothetical protein